MKEPTTTRLAALRALMKREHLAAIIVPTADPHGSEYVPEHWKTRQWISGFDGSAGTAVVTMTAAALWADSRYFIAAAEQLSDTEFILMKERIEGTPTIAGWLGKELADSPTKEVAVDGMVAPADMVEGLIAGLRANGGLTLRTNWDPFPQLWSGRPAVPDGMVEPQPLSLSGRTTAEKLGMLRRKLHQLKADGMLVTALDDVAWLLNMRGNDIHCNPVFVAYLLIDSTKATLFINKEKLTPASAAQLQADGIGIKPYSEVQKAVKDYFEYSILMDPGTTPYTLLHSAKREVVRQPSPVAAMKAVKTKEEQAGFREAMLRDGIAMTRFLMWLRPAVEKGYAADGGQKAPETELSASRYLYEQRRSMPLFRGLSFDTISAYGSHAAIVHYEPTPESDIPLRPEGLLLVDSGGQYQDGTTDITRTICLGPLTEEQRRVYTLVLKGHLRLQNTVFPEGASGTQIDAIAREPLWKEGLNYLHGTGHGVGSFLNVHEGPHQIRMEYRPAPLLEGMTVTDEPGIYLENRFGVRIENTLLTVLDRETEFGRFLRFEPLTLCPIDTEPIMADMLTAEERQWLNDYHRLVYERLAPCLEEHEQKWLLERTKPL